MFVMSGSVADFYGLYHCVKIFHASVNFLIAIDSLTRSLFVNPLIRQPQFGLVGIHCTLTNAIYLLRVIFSANPV